MLECEFLDPEQIVEFVDWLEEEDFIFEILGKMLSIRIAYYPLIIKEINSVSLE